MTTRSLRGSVVSRIVAAIFVALIVLPFTAPFQSYDGDAPMGKPPSIETSDKFATDAAFAVQVHLPCSTDGSPLTDLLESPATPVRRSPASTVLRL